MAKGSSASEFFVHTINIALPLLIKANQQVVPVLLQMWKRCRCRTWRRISGTKLASEAFEAGRRDSK